MAIELFNDGKHVCLMFNDLVGEEEVGAVQANQFLIVSDGEGANAGPKTLDEAIQYGLGFFQTGLPPATANGLAAKG